jgi:hypothetical protein
VGDEEELVSLLNKDPNTDTVIRGGRKLLEPHISVNWVRELSLMK